MCPPPPPPADGRLTAAGTMTRLQFRPDAATTADVTLVRIPPVAHDDDWALLSADERTRAARFVFDAGRSAFVTTRAGLRRRLAEETGLAAEALEFDVDGHGRPALRSAPPWPMDFNVSHCDTMAAIGVVRGRRIGVDIEAHGRVADLRALIPEVMGAGETALLQQLDGADFLRAFYGSWTRKEAVVKAIGVGLTYPVTTLDLPAGDAECEMTVQTTSADRWHVFTRELAPALTLSVAVGGATADTQASRP